MNDDEMFDEYHYHPEHLTTVMRALDWHLEYYEWMGTADYEDRMESFADAYFPTDDSRRQGIDVVHWLSEAEARLMQMGRTTWVQNDICTYLEAAIENMPPSILHYHDLPYDSGLIVFDRPLLYWDHLQATKHSSDECSVPLRGLGWMNSHSVGRSDAKGGHNGLLIWIYTDREYCNHAFRETIQERGMDRIEGPQLMLLDMTAWLYDAELWSEQGSRPFHQDPDAHIITFHMGRIRRYLLALFLFMQQEIVASSEERPPRPARRRAERAGVAAPDSIVVIHLRRMKHASKGTEEDEAERQEIEWTHRWIVRAHWRQIIDKKTGQPRLVPVREYVKGPEDKPLVIKERIISVDR